MRSYAFLTYFWYFFLIFIVIGIWYPELKFWTNFVILMSICNHFMCRMLSMYDVGEEDSDAATDQSQISLMGQSSPIHMQLPVVEVMKVLTSYFCLLDHFYHCCYFADISMCYYCIAKSLLPFLTCIFWIINLKLSLHFLRVTFLIVLALYGRKRSKTISSVILRSVTPYPLLCWNSLQAHSSSGT